MSAFWGLGIGCLIEHFENDIDKIVHAFYPLFKTWVQQDYHALKKLSDLSISIRRFMVSPIFVSSFRNFQRFAFLLFSFKRLLVTDNAQCGAWAAWCTANKKARNAKISHAEHPARSDAVKFFFFTLDSDTYKHFNFKATLYQHFQNLLSTPEKALLLSDANFATKVNPSRRYPPCDINTTQLFDEEGDPIFNMDNATSFSPPATPTTDSSRPKRQTKPNAGLKRTLCATLPKRKRSKKETQPVEAPPPTVPQATVVTEPEPTPSIPTQSVQPKPKPYRHPQLLTLPSKVASPINQHDMQFLSFSFLPVAGLKGIELFNSFLTFCTNSENNAVLVSRAYVSQSFTSQGSMLAIRQV